MAEPETLAERLCLIIDLSGLGLNDVDRLAGLKSEGHTGQIARGTKPTPRAAIITAIAYALGTTAEYLVDGRGAAPSERRVRRAVAEARERLGVHPASLAPKSRARKVNTRTGRSPVRSARAAGDSR